MLWQYKKAVKKEILIVLLNVKERTGSIVLCVLLVVSQRQTRLSLSTPSRDGEHKELHRSGCSQNWHENPRSRAVDDKTNVRGLLI